MKRIAVLGAGIVGLNLALEAIKRGFEVTVFEESSGLGRGASGHTAGVLHVLQTPFSSWKGRLALEGNSMYDVLSKELGFRVRRMPALLVFKRTIERPLAMLISGYLKRKGFRVGVIGKEKVLELCPDISRKVRGAIMVEGYGTVVPNEVLNSFVRHLRSRGVELHFNEKVISVKDSNNYVEILTSSSSYLFDEVFVAIGGGVKELFHDIEELEFAKGVMVLTRGLECNAIVAALFSRTRSKKTKGGGIIPWPDGRILFGPSFEDTSDPWDVSVTREEVENTVKNYLDLIEAEPKIDEFFAGTRVKAPPRYDFIVRRRGKVTLIYGVDSPGFTAAPALARHILSKQIR